MTTVARVVRSSPHRDTVTTWETIVNLLTNGKDCPARTELLSVTGVASSIIADQAPRASAIVVTCDGPRTRLYCLYDEDAVDGSDAKEDMLSYDPLAGDWQVSLPCSKDELAWVGRALKAKSTRITARDLASTLGESQKSFNEAPVFTIDMDAFLKS